MIEVGMGTPNYDAVRLDEDGHRIDSQVLSSRLLMRRMHFDMRSNSSSDIGELGFDVDGVCRPMSWYNPVMRDEIVSGWWLDGPAVTSMAGVDSSAMSTSDIDADELEGSGNTGVLLNVADTTSKSAMTK
jgi:hypothetical protein